MVSDISLQIQSEIRSGLVRTQVLIVDEDRAMRRYLRSALAAHGYQVYDFDTPKSVLAALYDYRPNVLILDPESGDNDGIPIIAEIRKNWDLMPVLVISEQTDISFRIRALDAGANDYMVKPFSIEELAARIRVAIRHAQPSNTLFVIDDLTVDIQRQIVRKKGQFVRLTPIEYELLKRLINNAGIVMSAEQLSRSLWGDEARRHVRRLRVHMSNLRTKLETDPAHPELILTEPGSGYRLRITD
jgi:two-component system KDP operon response regulator KdpE